MIKVKDWLKTKGKTQFKLVENKKTLTAPYALRFKDNNYFSKFQVLHQVTEPKYMLTVILDKFHDDQIHVGISAGIYNISMFEEIFTNVMTCEINNLEAGGQKMFEEAKDFLKNYKDEKSKGLVKK